MALYPRRFGNFLCTGTGEIEYLCVAREIKFVHSHISLCKRHACRTYFERVCNVATGIKNSAKCNKSTLFAVSIDYGRECRVAGNGDDNIGSSNKLLSHRLEAIGSRKFLPHRLRCLKITDVLHQKQSMLLNETRSCRHSISHDFLLL